MAAGDVSAIIDLASVPEVSSSPAPEPEPVIDPAPESTSPESADTPPESAEGEGESEATSAPPPDPQVDARTNPAQVRAALKTLRDSDPKNAPIARELNDAYGRYQAYKSAFGTVAEARDAKAFLEANGGIEGLTQLHQTIQSVNETDSLLYSGDPRVLDNLIEDMRTEGKLDSFTKLAGPFLDKLRGLDEKGYFNALKPHFYQGLVDTGVPNVVGAMLKALSAQTPDIETAKGLLTEFSNWLNGLRDSVEREDKSKLDPDRQAFEKERTEFQTQKQKEFQNSIASAAESYNNQALGGALKSYLKLPYFKNMGRESLLDLATGLKSRLLSELTADKSYQSQMDAFFAAKNPDKAKITQYHNAKVDTMAQRIVKSVVETRYPDYAKRGSVAKPAAKAAAAAPAEQARPSGKPEFVKAKPEWDAIDWSRDPEKMLFITGRAYLKNGGKFVTWSKKYA